MSLARKLRREREYYPGIHYQKLFNLLHQEHGLKLLESEMQDIIKVVREMDILILEKHNQF